MTLIQKCLNRNGLPILVTLVSFWHFAIVRQQTLIPSIAFTSILGDCRVGFVRGVLTDIIFYAVFSEMKYALSALPETLIKMLQVCSLLLPTYMYPHRLFRASSPFRIETYLNSNCCSTSRPAVQNRRIPILFLDMAARSQSKDARTFGGINSKT